MKLISNEVINSVKYGRIIISTRLGELEYSYRIGSDYDDDYQLESSLKEQPDFTDDEEDEIHELINKEMYK